MKILRWLYLSLVVAYIPLVFLIPRVLEDESGWLILPYALVFILFAWITLPWYFLFVQTGLAVGRMVKREEPMAGRILALSGLALAVCSVVLFCMEQAYICLYMAGAQLLLWMVDAIVFRRRLPAALRRWQFWLLTVVVTAVIFSGIMVYDWVETSQNRPDPQAETEQLAE